MVVELAVPLEALREPEGERRPPYELDPGFTFERERLQFLVWANTYDARGGRDPVWWWATRAGRVGARPAPDGPAQDTGAQRDEPSEAQNAN